MAKPDLATVRRSIIDSLSKGKTEKEIRQHMLEAGYTKEQIAHAFSSDIGRSLPKKKLPSQRKLIVILAVIVIIFSIIGVRSYLDDMNYQQKMKAWRIAYGLERLSVEPIQTPFSETDPLIVEQGENRFIITRLAEYSITAVVLNKQEQYDYFSELSPYDMGLAWKGPADPKCDGHFYFRNSGYRVLYTEIVGDAPKNCYENYSQLSNNHLIPANDNVLQGMRDTSERDIVTMEGYLVSVQLDRPEWSVKPWKSSLSRTDVGSVFLSVTLEGSCEIMYVEKIQLNDKIYL